MENNATSIHTHEREGGISSSCPLPVSVGSKLRKAVLDTATNINESLQYIKAFFVAQKKRLVAKNEEELAEADLQAGRMQVQAADAAEAHKEEHRRQLHVTNK